MSAQGSERPIFFITSPLEQHHVDRIAAHAGDRIEVRYAPHLLPPTRYVNDHNGIDGFRHTEEQRAEYLKHVSEATILWDFPVLAESDPPLASLTNNLDWVQTTSAGVGQLVQRLGIADSNLTVTTASGVHAQPLAEFVMLVLLTHVKQLLRAQEDQIARRWVRFTTDELPGKTMAIVGPGRIGKRVAELARAFGMRVTAMGRRYDPKRAAELGVDTIYPREQMHEMFAEADCVVLCCPHTPETENLIDADAFNAMKDGVVLVNIARGQVVVEGALYNALTSGKIAFAGLDVFRNEPLPPDSPFWDLPNVLVSPHSMSTVFRENERIVDIFLHNLDCYLENRHHDMRNRLDFSTMY